MFTESRQVWGRERGQNAAALSYDDRKGGEVNHCDVIISAVFYEGKSRIVRLRSSRLLRARIFALRLENPPAGDRDECLKSDSRRRQVPHSCRNIGIPRYHPLPRPVLHGGDDKICFEALDPEPGGLAQQACPDGISQNRSDKISGDKLGELCRRTGRF